MGIFSDDGRGVQSMSPRQEAMFSCKSSSVVSLRVSPDSEQKDLIADLGFSSTRPVQVSRHAHPRTKVRPVLEYTVGRTTFEIR